VRPAVPVRNYYRAAGRKTSYSSETASIPELGL